MPNVPTYPSEKVPLNAREQYYYAMSTDNPAPDPQNREEWWLKQIADRMDQAAESAEELDERVTALESPADSVVLHSSTEGSEKLFRITVDDTGEITATEITESAGE